MPEKPTMDQPPSAGERGLIDAARRQLARIRHPAADEFGSSEATQLGRGPGRAVAARWANLPKDVVPGYHILREIHRGGQGVVYLAVQQSTRRNVAIKVMKDGLFAGPTDRARFDREIEMLGRLSHPHVVTIHDSGEAAGCQYFVMDYVAGKPLDVHVAPLGLRDRLRLFATICEAVNAAHLRGIIHRDLKPGNIRIDDAGAPRILDFGLAKTVADKDASSAMTVTGQFVGSLSWAAPEQAEGSAERIDLRTDVYSLGVVLYQVLTGGFPYDVTGSLGDVFGRITRSEPTPPRAIRRDIDDEVETIVLKCLAKEPDRRYQSAGELARDIRHYLAGEPIEAKRDSAAYVLRKHLLRYRVSIAVAVGFLFVILTGLIVSLAGWRTADQQRGLAQSNLNRARNAEATAKREAENAQIKADTAERVRDVLVEMFKAVDPYQGAGGKTPAADLLDGGVAKALEEFEGEPEAQASLLEALGQAYCGLGMYERSLEILEQALEIHRKVHPVSQETAACLEAIVSPLSERGALVEAESRQRQALTIREQINGVDSRESMTGRSVLGELLRGQAKYQEAEPLIRDAVEGLRRHSDVRPQVFANCLTHYGLLLNSTGRFRQAEPPLREAVQILESHGRDRDMMFAYVLNGLGVNLKAQAKFEEAETIYRRGLSLRKELLGEEHPAVGTALNNLGMLLKDAGKLADAEPLLLEALEVRRKAHDSDHPSVANSLDNYASLVQLRKRFDEAESLMRESLEIRRRLLGERHPQVARSMNNLGGLLKNLGRPGEAEQLLRQAVEIDREAYGGDHPAIAILLLNLAGALEDLERFDESEKTYFESLELSRRTVGPEHPNTEKILRNFACHYQQRQNLAAAEPLLRECLSILRNNPAAAGTSLPERLKLLGSVLLDLERLDEAVPVLEEALSLYDSAESDDLDSAETHRLLGRVLAGQQRFAEAEPFLTDSATMFIASAGESNPKTVQAIEDVIAFYDQWSATDPSGDHQDQVDRWQAQLQSTDLAP